MKRKRLVTVEIAPGRFAKMYEQDAAARVVVGRGTLGRENKRLKPEGNKASLPVKVPEAADDLTSIPGIGNVAAATLHALGITTLAQLRAADLSGMPTRIRRVVEVWRG